MNFEALKIFKIDIENDFIETINHESYGEDLNRYLSGLIKLVTENNKGRNFVFQRESTEVRSLMKRIFSGEDFDVLVDNIGGRLLECEKLAQKKIENLETEIQKGILILAIIEEDDCRKFVICKADHNDFLSETNFVITRGLPIKKRVFKAFICPFDDSLFSNVVVYDSNTTMSSYWWKEFLELNELYDDTLNTKRAFDSLETIFKKIKKDYPQDYVHLRNSAVRYFRANSNFELQDFLTNAIGNYEPYNSDLNIPDLKEKISRLPESKKFDNHFKIQKKEVTAKFLSKIPLTDQIELHLKEDIVIENTIVAEISQDGTKYVKIRSDKGYEYFKPKG